MACSRSMPDSAAADFNQLFRDRFNELDSFVTSSQSSPALVFERSKASCAPCSSLAASSDSKGYVAMQWLALFLLIVAITFLLIHIFRKISKNKNYGATLLPSVEQKTPGGTVFAQPAALKPDAAGSSGSPKHVTDPSNIFAGSPSKLCMYLFYATWCGHCQELKPHFEEVSKQHLDVDFKLVENEVLQKSPEKASLDVKGFPTIVAMKGREALGKLIGNQGKEKLQEFVKAMKSK